MSDEALQIGKEIAQSGDATWVIHHSAAADRYAIVDDDKRVWSVTMWDPGVEPNWKPPHGYTAVKCGPEVGPGDLYDPVSGLFAKDLTPPPKPRELTPLEFIDLFTNAEQLAIVGATMSVPQVKLWYDMMLAAQTVQLDNPRLRQGLEFMVTNGLLTQERFDEIVG